MCQCIWIILLPKIPYLAIQSWLISSFDMTPRWPVCFKEMLTSKITKNSHTIKKLMTYNIRIYDSKLDTSYAIWSSHDCLIVSLEDNFPTLIISKALWKSRNRQLRLVHTKYNLVSSFCNKLFYFVHTLCLLFIWYYYISMNSTDETSIQTVSKAICRSTKDCYSVSPIMIVPFVHTNLFQLFCLQSN